MMQAFRFALPEEVIFGRGSLARLPELVKRTGARKAFLISGPHLARMGAVQRCRDLLSAAGIESDAFTETEGNPSTVTVDRAAAGYLASGAACIIALGGGSPMDVAKAAGVTARYGGSIADYEGAGRIPGAIPPLIAVPTTAGTGSEVTSFAVITDHSRNYKLTVSGSELIPDFALLDPELITTAPAGVAAACGMDALIHAMEAYVSKAASPFSDAMAEKAMELIGGSLRRYAADRSDPDAAEAMLAGSMFAGIAFSQARLGDVHAMSHPVSAYFGVAHGVANAILLPAVVDFNALADHGKYERIYRCIARRPRADFVPEQLGDEIRTLNAALGIPASLREVGVTEDRFEAMAEDAMKSGNVAVNPRQTAKKDILNLYRLSW